ncbi:hypothetical protein [Lysobacter sp. HA35]
MIGNVATVDLDYRRVRDVPSLIRWAEEAFALPPDSRGESNISRFSDVLFHHIGRGTTAYTVVEHNIGSCTTELKQVIASPGQGWKTSLVSGIPHDYGLHLTFSEVAPLPGPRKWRRPW